MSAPRPCPTGRDVFVLSGGGSRGAAQVGMLRGLLGAGVVPDAIVGASVGALNSCFLAVDPTAARVELLADQWLTMTARTLTGALPHVALNLARRRPYLFSADRLRALVRRWVETERLEDLAVPVRVATTHLVTGRPVHHDRGRLVDLLAASTALPALFPPVLLRAPGEASPAPHVDAGISENVPLSGALGLLDRGDRVWVLDVTKTATPRLLHHPVDVLISALVATVRNQPVPQPPDGVDVVRVKLDEAFDCGTVFDFSHTATLFRLGEQAATAALLAPRAAA